jgi:hypothetical protein
MLWVRKLLLSALMFCCCYIDIVPVVRICVFLLGLLCSPSYYVPYLASHCFYEQVYIPLCCVMFPVILCSLSCFQLLLWASVYSSLLCYVLRPIMFLVLFPTTSMRKRIYLFAVLCSPPYYVPCLVSNCFFAHVCIPPCYVMSSSHCILWLVVTVEVSPSHVHVPVLRVSLSSNFSPV